MIFLCEIGEPTAIRPGTNYVVVACRLPADTGLAPNLNIGHAVLNWAAAKEAEVAVPVKSKVIDLAMHDLAMHDIPQGHCVVVNLRTFKECSLCCFQALMCTLIHPPPDLTAFLLHPGASPSSASSSSRVSSGWTLWRID